MKITIEHYILYLIKAGHQYVFRFRIENIQRLFFELIMYGKEEKYNLDLIEMLDVIRQMASYRREHGGLKDFRFNINEANPGLQPGVK